MCSLSRGNHSMIVDLPSCPLLAALPEASPVGWTTAIRPKCPSSCPSSKISFSTHSFREIRSNFEISHRGQLPGTAAETNPTQPPRTAGSAPPHPCGAACPSVARHANSARLAVVAPGDRRVTFSDCLAAELSKDQIDQKMH